MLPKRAETVRALLRCWKLVQALAKVGRGVLVQPRASSRREGDHSIAWQYQCCWKLVQARPLPALADVEWNGPPFGWLSKPPRASSLM